GYKLHPHPPIAICLTNRCRRQDGILNWRSAAGTDKQGQRRRTPFDASGDALGSAQPLTETEQRLLLDVRQNREYPTARLILSRASARLSDPGPAPTAGW